MFSKRLTKQIQVCWPQDEITATNLNKLLANIFYGDPEGVKSILRHDNDLLQINCPNIQGLTVLQYAWLLRDLNMTKLLLAHFSQLNNGIEMAYEQIKDFMPDKSTYSSRHRNLFYNTINFDILAKKIIFLYASQRFELKNL